MKIIRSPWFWVGLVFGWVVAEAVFPSKAHAEEHPLILVEGVITYGTMTPAKEELTKRIMSDDRGDIDLLIDSPGGSVTAGQELINLLNTAKAGGFTVNCYVSNVAASMAFQLFTQCTNRWALPGSYLLWHGVRVATRDPITEENAKDLQMSLHQMNALVLHQLAATLRLPARTIALHYHKETLWSGISLSRADPKFMTLVDGYPTLMRRLKTAIKPGMEPIFFGNMYEFIYMWSGYKGGDK